MPEREKDLAWEALVEVTGADVEQMRGQLNAALGSIRKATVDEGWDEEELVEAIHARAAGYRELFADVPLTPTAFSKWWNMILPELERRVEASSRAARGEAPASSAEPALGERLHDVRRRLLGGGALPPADPDDVDGGAQDPGRPMHPKEQGARADGAVPRL